MRDANESQVSEVHKFTLDTEIERRRLNSTGGRVTKVNGLVRWLTTDTHDIYDSHEIGEADGYSIFWPLLRACFGLRRQAFDYLQS